MSFYTNTMGCIFVIIHKFGMCNIVLNTVLPRAITRVTNQLSGLAHTSAAASEVRRAGLMVSLSQPASSVISPVLRKEAAMTVVGYP